MKKKRSTSETEGGRRSISLPIPSSFCIYGTGPGISPVGREGGRVLLQGSEGKDEKGVERVEYKTFSNSGIHLSGPV